MATLQFVLHVLNEQSVVESLDMSALASRTGPIISLVLFDHLCADKIGFHVLLT